VNEDLLVRRAALQRQTSQEGRIKPAGKLVEALEVKVDHCRRALRRTFDDVVPRDAAVQPNVENVVAFRQTFKF